MFANINNEANNMLNKILLSILALNLFLLTTVSSANDELEALSNQLNLKNASTYSQSYITGGQPSIGDLEKMAASNIQVIINLRGEGEFSQFNEQEKVESLGMKYISLPISNAQDINAESIKKFHQILAENKGNSLIHCASGNRVGAFFTLAAFTFDNKTAEEALVIGNKTGLTRLEDHVIKMMKTTKGIQ